jgi:hypothetical protein
MTKTPRPAHALDRTVEAEFCPDELVITSCVEHGVKATADRDSFIAYVEMAEEHRAAGDHDDTPFECWVCCPDMVIDPNGLAKVEA